ncbi:MmcQ/YjbR family DNA-binding protein [Paenibacillus chitinolyticus]|uniref:MmcQ/YjbR family DNA-binding protein n=1 Tax=Paenibacillus chitinolyticus TaxID=79263 RepID=UPI002DB8FF67|nr:MmcQ/YjbR family DNA-binding protein [Paenibacillus chitinolyticus]MEC0247048.1 MmcQ/YjbR family DNA-binding protein [Paenibacillus chitinolyticus]
MNTNEVMEYALSKPGAVADRPFDNETDVLRVGGKMFALLPSGAAPGEGSVTLKCPPEEAELLRMQYPEAVKPGYHMNKRHWNTVRLDGSLDPQEIMDMVDVSYQLVRGSLSKKMQQHILQYGGAEWNES